MLKKITIPVTLFFSPLKEALHMQKNGWLYLLLPMALAAGIIIGSLKTPANQESALALVPAAQETLNPLPWAPAPATTGTPSASALNATPNPMWAVREIDADNDTVIKLYNHRKDAVENITVREYLVGVLAGEMPATYEAEALKAQAVAARSYLYYKKSNGGARQNSEADISSDSSYCQAYSDVSMQKKKWGDKYDEYAQKLLRAVTETNGQVLTYNGNIIEALYHSSSYEKTENVQAVYGNTRPYLVSVSSPEAGSIDIDAVVFFTYQEAAGLLNKAFPSAKVTAADLPNQLKVLTLNESGRAEKVQVGATECSGVDLRRALGLRSSSFTLQMTGKLRIVSRGHGHGIGMSQAGAQALAKDGTGYAEILSHYYPGTVLGSTGGK